MSRSGHGLHLAAVFVVVLLSACATPTQTRQLLQSPADIPLAAEVAEVPFYDQRDYQCGPAALAMVINHYGEQTTAQALIGQVYIPQLKGSLQPEMLAAAARYQRLAIELDGRLNTLLRVVAEGYPVLVMQNLGLQSYPFWHYAVVTGYDLEKGEIMLNSGERERLVRPLSVFERTWQRAEYWAVAVTAVDRLPQAVSRQASIDALLRLETVASADTLIRAYRTGLQQWPASFVLHMGLGNAYFAQRQFALAEQSFLAATRTQPQRAEAWNNLAYALLYQGRKQQALEAVGKATRLVPDSGEYQHSLAEIQAYPVRR